MGNIPELDQRITNDASPMQSITTSANALSKSVEDFRRKNLEANRRAKKAMDYLREEQEKRAVKKLPRWMCATDEKLKNQQRTIHALVLMVMAQVVAMCALAAYVINQ